MLVAASCLSASSLSAAVKTKEIAYNHDGTELKGTLAWDDAQTGKRPVCSWCMNGGD